MAVMIAKTPIIPKAVSMSSDPSSVSLLGSPGARRTTSWLVGYGPEVFQLVAVLGVTFADHECYPVLSNESIALAGSHDLDKRIPCWLGVDAGDWNPPSAAWGEHGLAEIVMTGHTHCGNLRLISRSIYHLAFSKSI